MNFTPANRLDVPESQLGSRTGLSTPDLSHVRIEGADLLEEWVARLAGHQPGVRDYRGHYRAMATELGFEGHMNSAEAMPFRRT